jgi:hypothetical protein
MARPHVVSLPLARLWRDKYEQGATTVSLAAEYNTTKATVARNIRRAGGRIRTWNEPKPVPRRGLLAWLAEGK